MHHVFIMTILTIFLFILIQIYDEIFIIYYTVYVTIFLWLFKQARIFIEYFFWFNTRRNTVNEYWLWYIVVFIIVFMGYGSIVIVVSINIPVLNKMAILIINLGLIIFNIILFIATRMFAFNGFIIYIWVFVIIYIYIHMARLFPTNIIAIMNTINIIINIIIMGFQSFTIFLYLLQLFNIIYNIF